MKTYYKYLLLPVSLFIFLCSATAQTYQVDLEKSKMSVLGTSTLHDWESIVETIKGSGKIAVEGSKVTSIENLNVTIPVKSIKSGKSGMDKNTYNALKEEQHPNISFTISSVAEQSGNSLLCKGKLTIGAVTNDIEMPVNYKMDGSTVIFSSEVDLKMTDYGIAPPTAMLGSIKTGDDITINYSVAFKQ